MDQHLLSPPLEDRLRHDVEEAGLLELWPRLRQVARPSYAVELVPDADLDRLGTSRLGGLPDLPAGKAWPARDGKLLTFIAQVNLAEVPRLPVPLPESGMLFFFLGIDEPASNIAHDVLFASEPGPPLARPAQPDPSAFLNQECTGFQPVGVRFVPAVSLPDFSFDRCLDGFGDRLEELRERLESPSDPWERSQLLGYPLGIMSDPQAAAYVAVNGHANILYAMHRTPADLDRELAAAEAKGDTGLVEYLQRQKQSLLWFHGARERHRQEIGHWQLLLEVASHEQCGMCWWDAGRLQFLIDTRDLQARNFSRTHACIQSS